MQAAARKATDFEPGQLVRYTHAVGSKHNDKYGLAGKHAVVVKTVRASNEVLVRFEGEAVDYRASPANLEPII